MLAPIDFIKEKYIQPNHLTQDALCEALDIGKKTLSELYQHKRGFTLHTAKKFAKFFDINAAFILMKQLEYDLAHDTQTYEKIQPFKALDTQKKQESSAKWLLASINNSISDERQHYTLEDLLTLFGHEEIAQKYAYAVGVLFTQVDYVDVMQFCTLYGISKNALKRVYDFYIHTFDAQGVKAYEWLFQTL
ncbi:MAG: hypothetical protein KU37_07055 [Sulfuricurvum sp. PC08-66]|nr:MAG: hypothetical protein KU37_07055 [Sulfuricurvum sp. PC08-66]